MLGLLGLVNEPLEAWMLDHDGRGLAGVSRELAFLDAKGRAAAGLRRDAARPQRAPVPP